MPGTDDPDGADRETFRHVIGHFASGVTVLTTRSGDEDFGATASAMSSLSLEPPMLLVCLNTRSSTQEAIHASGVLGVNILDEDQGVIAEQFAAPRGDKFAGVDVVRGVGEVPLLGAALAYCECRVVDSVVAGTHRVFLTKVVRATAREGSPLTYFRGTFGRFEVEQDRAVYGELRARILSRAISLDDSLQVDALARELDTLPATVYHAITKLVADGLLERDPARGYVVKPITPASSEHAFDARCAIEVGVAVTTVGHRPTDRIRALRRLMAEAEATVAGDRFVDVDEFAKGSEAFHTALVGLSDNPALLDAYGRLGIVGLTLSLLTVGSAGGEDILDDHRAIVAAFERGDVDEAVAAIVRHNANVKATNRRAIEAAGGQV